MSVIYYLFLFVFLFLCVVLCAVILVQESKTMGLGSSFGGEASSSLFGTSTADIVKKITAWLAVAFLTGAIILSQMTASSHREHNSFTNDEHIEAN